MSTPLSVSLESIERVPVIRFVTKLTLFEPRFQTRQLVLMVTNLSDFSVGDFDLH